MRYSYPKISSALTYKRIDAYTVEVTDHLTDNIFTFDIEAARYFRQLDGYTNPYKISTVFNREEVDNLIEVLDECGLTRLSNTIDVSFGTKMKTLWIPKRSAFLKSLACLCNALLLISWLPVFIIGIFVLINTLGHIEINCIWLGCFIGIFGGVLFHELGHAFAGISYGARVFEIGIMVTYCILSGAYVLLDMSLVKKKLQRIQIDAAGVEMNFLLCGVFLIFGALAPSFGGIFISAAVCNAFIGAINLTFIKGLDGTSIVSELLGIDDIIDSAKNIVFNRKARKRVIRQGPSGYATVIMCYMLFALQIALPVLLITNVLEVILCVI